MKIKLLFFINTLSGGGAEKVLVDLVNCLDKSIYEISIVSVFGGIQEHRLLPHIKYRKLFNCKIKRISKILYRCFIRLPKWLVRKIIIREQFDFEIAYLEGFATKVIAYGKSNAKKIAFVHCDVSVKPVLKSFYKSINNCLSEYMSFDKVAFVSKSAMFGFENTFGKLNNAEVVHNVINLEEIISKSKRNTDFDYNTKGLKIISVGRLSDEKGFDRLIRIASSLEDKYDFEICILGEGENRAQLEMLIKNLNVHNVRLLGFQENPYSFMKKADLFICSSLYEGYSTVVTESLALGIPVLTTECAGMDELLCNGLYGCIVKNDEQALLEGLKLILNKPEVLKEYELRINNIVFNDSLCEFNDLLHNITG